MTYEKKECLIDIDKISLSFGPKLILRDVNARIHNITRPDQVQGQVVCFLGPSGIGKTQLSRIIAGLQRASSGTVCFNFDGTGHFAKPGLVGMVPQNYQIFDFLTVKENFWVARKQGFGIEDPKGYHYELELTHNFGLDEHLGKYPNQLSGGQKQRVSIVRQLLCGHQFIIMDEPFSGLDLVMKKKACQVITQTANLHDHNTIIVVTHDVTEGMSIADTVWLMGREKGAEGAKILEEIDLAKDGLCWNPDIQNNPMFLEKVRDVKAKFLEISAN